VSTRKASQRIFAFSAFVVLVLSLFVSVPVYAQVAGATLSGTVIDASGAAIPQVSVSIRNVATGITTTAAANANGFYTATNLLPGSYEIKASASGFATVVRTGITLTVGAQQVLDFTLQVGQVTQTVEVTGEAPAVETTSSAISGVVNQTTVVELPLNGRDWTLLAALQPGVNAITTQQPIGGTSSRSTRGNGAQISVSGTRPQLNNYRLDGISIVDFAGGSPGSVLGISLGVDAIQEFSVLTSNSTAEYGRTSGGVINAITKSGTNSFHGDAYEFIRNNKLDARKFFDVGTPPPFRRNQFGGAVGGPIQKDKTFFFADYEGFRQALGTTNANFVPSADARNGILNFSDPSKFPSGCVATAVANQCQLTVDPLVKPFFAFYPLPNGGLVAPGNTGIYNVAPNTVTSENFVTAKGDRKLSAKDNLSVTFFRDTGSSTLPDAFNEVLTGDTSYRLMAGLEETHTFSSGLVNAFRVGYSRVHTDDTFVLQGLSPLASDTSFGSYPGRAAPQIFVSGLTALNATVGSLGRGVINFWNSFQYYDDAFLTRGDHSMKFGFAFERMQSNPFPSGGDNGVFKFGSLANFLTNKPTSFVATPANKVTGFGIRQSLFGVYFQDDWRVRRALTLNLGLRYEMVTVPTEIQGHLSNYRDPTDATPHLGSPYFINPTKRNFAPRIGFAWDPFRNGKTAVRGAFGIFDALPLNYAFIKGQGATSPFTGTVTATGLAQGSFPTGAVAFVNSAPDPVTKQRAYSIQFNPRRNYVMIWNLNVQQQLTPSMSLMVGYVGNHGVHMLNRTDDVNFVLPTATAQGYLWPTPIGSGQILNSHIGNLRYLYWGGDSNYNSLEIQATKRMSHGLQLQTSFTWAKNIDTGSASNIGDPFVNSIVNLLWFCKSCRRGLSDYNIGRAFKVNYIYEVPTPKNWGAAASHVLGGWEVGGIVTAQDGVPFTPVLAGDPLGMLGAEPTDYPNRLTGPGCDTAVNPGNPSNYIKLSCFAFPNPANLMGNAGRNSLIGPGLVNFDFSLFKNNYIRSISESFNAQFRAEFFNVFNRANFAPPIDNSALFDASGSPVGGAGALNLTSTSAREIQFALKLIF
jgi:hypothetical protein